MEQKVNSAHLKGEVQPAIEKGLDLEKRRKSLVARLKAGNRDAADELVEMYYEQIYLYMRRLGHERQNSEDLTQESFIQAWQHLGQIRDDSSLNGWFYRIASNVSNVYWRRNKIRKTGTIEGFEIADNTGNHKSLGDFELLDNLNVAIAALPRKLREAVVLHYMQHLTIAETAQATGIREGTCKSRLSRALDALRKQIL
ncbi:MAG: RNA polymerase sigma factor [Planctomycetota bacterium]|jgi:RNA polymerase sigma-70 factor (ECF subfamily)